MASVDLWWDSNPEEDSIVRYEIERRPIGPSLHESAVRRFGYRAFQSFVGGWRRVGEVPGTQLFFNDGGRMLLRSIVRPSYMHNKEVLSYQGYEYRIRAVSNKGQAGPWVFCRVNPVAAPPPVVPPVPEPILQQILDMLQQLRELMSRLWPDIVRLLRSLQQALQNLNQQQLHQLQQIITPIINNLNQLLQQAHNLSADIQQFPPQLSALLHQLVSIITQLTHNLPGLHQGLSQQQSHELQGILDRLNRLLQQASQQLEILRKMQTRVQQLTPAQIQSIAKELQAELQHTRSMLESYMHEIIQILKDILDQKPVEKEIRVELRLADEKDEYDQGYNSPVDLDYRIEGPQGARYNLLFAAYDTKNKMSWHQELQNVTEQADQEVNFYVKDWPPGDYRIFLFVQMAGATPNVAPERLDNNLLDRLQLVAHGETKLRINPSLPPEIIEINKGKPVDNSRGDVLVLIEGRHLKDVDYCEILAVGQNRRGQAFYKYHGATLPTTELAHFLVPQPLLPGHYALRLRNKHGWNIYNGKERPVAFRIEHPAGKVAVEIIEPKREIAVTFGTRTPLVVKGRVTGPAQQYDYILGVYSNRTGDLSAPGVCISKARQSDVRELPVNVERLSTQDAYSICLFAQVPGTGPVKAPDNIRARPESLNIAKPAIVKIRVVPAALSPLEEMVKKEEEEIKRDEPELKHELDKVQEELPKEANEVEAEIRQLEQFENALEEAHKKGKFAENEKAKEISKHIHALFKAKAKLDARIIQTSDAFNRAQAQILLRESKNIRSGGGLAQQIQYLVGLVDYTHAQGASMWEECNVLANAIQTQIESRNKAVARVSSELGQIMRVYEQVKKSNLFGLIDQELKKEPLQYEPSINEFKELIRIMGDILARLKKVISEVYQVEEYSEQIDAPRKIEELTKLITRINTGIAHVSAEDYEEIIKRQPRPTPEQLAKWAAEQKARG
jgi:signal transduction histidine kinase